MKEISLGRFGKIFSIRDGIWECLFFKSQKVFMGEVIKVIAVEPDNKLLGVVMGLKGYNSVKKGVNLFKSDGDTVTSLDDSEVVLAEVAVIGSGNSGTLSGNFGHVGDQLVNTGKVLNVRCGYDLLGGMYNLLDLVLKYDARDTSNLSLKERINFDSFPVERPAPGIIDRVPVHASLFTGIPVIDCFLPIGRGQRQLIIGDNGAGKTTLSLTVIMNQKRVNNRNSSSWDALTKSGLRSFTFIPCIYVIIGKKRSEIARLNRILTKSNCISYTCLLYTTSSDTAASQVFAPYAGSSISEWFRERSNDALVVYDDLTEQAVAYREVSLLLRRPPGREAFPGDIFYLHARLLERAAQMNTILGGGSSTSLPLVETKLGDITAYIPTNVISICDGQLVLSRSNPMIIDINKSVSRVGASAQTPIFADVSKNVKHVYFQYRRYKGVVEMGGDLNVHFRKFVDRGRRIDHFMSLAPYETISLFKQVIFFYLLARDTFDSLSLDFTDVFLQLLSNRDYIVKNVSIDVAHFGFFEVVFEPYFLSFPLFPMENDLVRYSIDLKKSLLYLNNLMINDSAFASRLMEAAKESEQNRLVRLSDPAFF